jgi:hypothetical protein
MMNKIYYCEINLHRNSLLLILRSSIKLSVIKNKHPRITLETLPQTFLTLAKVTPKIYLKHGEFFIKITKELVINQINKD